MVESCSSMYNSRWGVHLHRGGGGTDAVIGATVAANGGADKAAARRDNVHQQQPEAWPVNAANASGPETRDNDGPARPPRRLCQLRRGALRR